MGMNDFIKIGSKIKNLRKIRGLTQKEMAEKLKIPHSTYSNYENDNREPNSEILEKIAQTLNISISELITGNTLKNYDVINKNSEEKLKEQRINNIVNAYTNLTDTKNINFKKISIDYFNSIIKDTYKEIDNKYNKTNKFNLSDIEKIFFSTIVNIMILANESDTLNYNISSFSKDEIKEISNFLFNTYKIKVNEILKRNQLNNANK